MRIAVSAALCFLVGLAAMDHAGWIGYRGNDWTHFDKRTFPVAEVYAADRITIHDGNTITAVQLLGVATPEARLEDSDLAKRYTQARVRNRAVTLRLEPTQTRNLNGDLLAYVYLTDADDLNLDVIHDGKAFADRRVKHTLAGEFEQAESDARKKDRGIWATLTFEQMPGWRRQWLEQLRRERIASTQRSHQ